MITDNKLSTPKIREQRVEYLVPGVEIARDVYTDDGKVLVSAGTVINKQILTKLQNWQIDKVQIVAEVIVNPIIDPKVQQFINSYNNSVSVVQKAFDNIRETHEVPLDEFKKTSENLTESLAATSGNIIDQLYNLPKCDDYTFRHSVNVSIIAALIATWLKYPPDIVNAISLTGLLHDIGKALLPSELLNLPYRLAPEDYETYKKHVQFGYEMAFKTPGIAQSVACGVAEHHERTDGSGYPNGLTADDIHPYAKIVAVADLYDEALTINCEQPPAMSPYTSLEKLRDEVSRVDPKACLVFINNMTDFLSGNQVSLTDGSPARVVYINKSIPSRSIIQLQDEKVIDLNDHKTLRIKYIIR